MKRRVGFPVLAFFLCVSFIVALSSKAFSMDFSASSSTQVLWSTDYFDETRLDAAQYLKFDFRRVAGREGTRLKFYGRFSKDLNSGEDAQGRIYNFYLDFREVFPGVNFRLGRQFFYTTAGSGIVDGLKADYLNGGS